jgi:hypothetical protein
VHRVNNRKLWTGVAFAAVTVVVLGSSYAQQGPRGRSSYAPVDITEPFSATLARLSAQKPAVERDHMVVLNERYDLSNRPAAGVTMDRTKPVQEITADCGGSNGARVRLWKVELQKFADETGLTIKVRHYPPGTSKWNKIEHRMFCHITQNWRGRPLTDRAAVVELIAATTTKTGLKIQSALDTRIYQKGIKVSKAEMDRLDIKGDTFHPEWNYMITPRTSKS